MNRRVQRRQVPRAAWRGALLAMALLCASAPLHPSSAARPIPVAQDLRWPSDAVPGHVIVSVDSPSVVAAPAQSLQGAVASFGGQLRQLTGDSYLVTVVAGQEAVAVEALRGVAGVRASEPDRLRGWAVVPNDEQYPQQWAHQLTQAEAAWEHTTGNRTVRVALIDSGIKGDHPELVHNMVEQADVSSGTVVSRGARIDNDTCGLGHGTQVAGILGALGNNVRGIAGVAWNVGIVDLAVSAAATVGSCAGASDSAILAALHYATYHPAGPVDVVNLSVGGRQAYCPEAYERAIDEARREGVVVIAAAGNSGPNTAQVPASCPGVIAVGAVSKDGKRASYSASNRWIDLVAPGGGSSDDPDGMVLTTSRNGELVRVRGTSFAAPYVAGVVALIRSDRPELSPEEIESALERSAQNETLERSNDFGWGLVRADRALSYLSRVDTVPPAEVDPAFPVLRLHTLSDGPAVVRLADTDSATEPVRQSVHLSRAVFRDKGAVHAVLARADSFADALAGSALGMGIGPLLFNDRGEELSAFARRELRRALPAGSKVYVLGGETGLGRGVDEELRSIGYTVARLGGPTREETAVLIAREIARIRQRAGLPRINEALLAVRDDWPDAVAAGVLGARFAVPVLLTDGDELHPATAAMLQELHPNTVTLIGSPTRLTDQVALHAQRVARANTLLRLAGASRHGTASEVSRELLRRVGSVRAAILVNLERRDGYAHALSASVLAGAYGAVFVSVEGENGTALSAPASLLLEQVLQRRARPADLLGVVAGGEDLIQASAADALKAKLQGD